MPSRSNQLSSTAPSLIRHTATQLAHVSLGSTLSALVLLRESKVIEDAKTKKLFVFCVGKIADPGYEEACKKAADLLHQAGLKHSFTPKQTSHKRACGEGFVAVNAGYFWGHGPPEPYHLLNTGHEDLVDELLTNEHIIRLATYQSSSLAAYVPEVYEKYRSLHTSVLEHCPKLHANFKRSIFSTSAFNLGPQVCCATHVDCMNYTPGLCAVHALGDYDHTKGGHLVLMEAKLIIEFPPGCLILIPSALITHGNTPVQDGEIRVSFTQYTPGALFRYADNGFRTIAKFKKADPQGYEAMMAKKASRWAEGLKLWPMFDELVNRP